MLNPHWSRGESDIVGELADVRMNREDHLPDGGGCYALVIVLPKRKCIQVGKLGNALFPAGTYVYTGTAMSSLRARIAYHLRKTKKRHWHIDYLLGARGAYVKEVAYHLSSIRTECRSNRRIARLPGAKIIVPGFGSSDCRAGCQSHLIYFAIKPKRLARRAQSYETRQCAGIWRTAFVPLRSFDLA